MQLFLRTPGAPTATLALDLQRDDVVGALKASVQVRARGWVSTSRPRARD